MYNSGYTRGNVTGPETLQPAAIEENRLFVRYKLNPEDVPGFQISLENWNRFRNRFDGTGAAVYLIPKQELRFVRLIHSSKISEILSLITDDRLKIDLKNYIDKINQMIRDTDADLTKSVADQVQADRTHQNTLDEDIKKIKEFHSQKRTETSLLLSEKNKKLRVFTEDEESTLIHAQTWPLEDLTRSKTNLEAKEDEIEEKIKGLEKEIQSLDAEIMPIQEKISECEAKLQADLDEESYKEVRLSKEFHELKVEKLRGKYIPLTEENTALHIEVETIDNQIKLLDILIAKEAFIKDMKYNFPRRRERLLFRIQKHLREVEDIETSRIDINREWRELTNDREDLVPILGLKSDSSMYFL